MNQGTNLLTLNLESKKAVERMIKRLAADGLQVIPSFDLRNAKSIHVGSACSHHGDAECDCQMLVLLVYDDLGVPLTLIVHGKDQKTHFALAQPAEKEYERKLKTKVLQAIALEGFSAIKPD